MNIYHGRLVLHESLFFATREIGRLYETGRYLHNYALTYALGLATSPYFHAEQSPSYPAQLTPLNKRGIYVTPGRALRVDYALATFKYASNTYHVEMEKGSRNTPSFGRAKELAVGSEFDFVVFSATEALKLPRWVRVGLWMSKASVEWTVSPARLEKSKPEWASLPLNPLDVPGPLRAFDLISMPPSSLVDHVFLDHEWWVWEDESGAYRLPSQMAYTF